MSKEAMKLALEALEYIDLVNNDRYFLQPHECYILDKAITALREALAEQPAQQQEPEPDRVKFERHWRKTRGDKKANRELPRHPLQPQTYIQDSANRHWVTWQAAVRSVAPPASKPLTDEQREEIAKGWRSRNWTVGDIINAIEAAHGIKGDA